MKIVAIDCWNPAGLPAAITISLLLISSGCGQSVERSDDAVTLPIAHTDAQSDERAIENWPGWRGENASGVSAATDLPIHWSATDGVRWKTHVPGRGNSSPVVWGDHVLVTSAVGEGAGTSLVVDSFDRASGNLQWQADAGKTTSSTHVKNGYASASVATDGQLVFASFGSAGLFAFDLATGQKRWKADLGSLEHQWGSASSPALVGNRVVQLCDAAADSAIVGFDKSTGQEIWRTPRQSNGCWTTPIVVDAIDVAGGARKEIVVNGTGTEGGASGFLIAYDPDDGHELWRVKGTTDTVCPTAIFGSGLVVSTSGRNGPIFAIRPGGAGDVSTKNIVWRQSHGGAYVPTGIANRNRLYTIADGGVVTCFNLGNGETIWQERLKGNFTASLVVGDGHLYAMNEYGVMYVLAAGDKYEPLSTNDLDERTLATPAIAGHQLFLRSETQLYCIETPADIVTGGTGLPADVAAAPSQSAGK